METSKSEDEKPLPSLSKSLLGARKLELGSFIGKFGPNKKVPFGVLVHDPIRGQPQLYSLSNLVNSPNGLLAPKDTVF